MSLADLRGTCTTCGRLRVTWGAWRRLTREQRAGEKAQGLTEIGQGSLCASCHRKEQRGSNWIQPGDVCVECGRLLVRESEWDAMSPEERQEARDEGYRVHHCRRMCHGCYDHSRLDKRRARRRVRQAELTQRNSYPHT